MCSRVLPFGLELGSVLRVEFVVVVGLELGHVPSAVDERALSICGLLQVACWFSEGGISGPPCDYR